MGIEVVKMVRISGGTFYFRVNLHHRLADTYTLPLCLLMGIKSAKVCAAPKIFFRAGPLAKGHDPSRSGYKLAFKCPNAHRLGKIHRVLLKIFRQPPLGRSPP